MKKLLLFGANGGLGKTLQTVYNHAGFEVRSVSSGECDLRSVASINSFLTKLKQESFHPEKCIFAAGRVYAGPISQVDPKGFWDCLMINAVGPQLICLEMMKQGPVKFIFIGSGASEFYFKGLIPYGMAKGFLRDFNKNLRLELGAGAFSSLFVFPGGLDTDFNSAGVLYDNYKLPSGLRPKDPASVAALIFKADQAGKKSLILSYAPFAIGLIQFILPNFLWKKLFR